MSMEHALILLNLGTCTLGGWICMCRMAKMSHTETKLEIRIQYMIWFCLFTLSGWSFIVGQPATVVQFLMSAAVGAHLMLGLPIWRWRAPDYTRRLA